MAKPVILWVEDNANDVLLLRQAFAEAKLAVEMVVPENAVLAFRYMEGKGPYRLAPHPPDLILIDINLPVMRGAVVLAEMRKHVPWNSIPILMFTSSKNDQELQGCRDLGAAACLTKPATFEGYRAIVERLRQYLPYSGGHPTTPPEDDPSPDDRSPSDRYCVPSALPSIR